SLSRVRCSITATIVRRRRLLFVSAVKLSVLQITIVHSLTARKCRLTSSNFVEQGFGLLRAITATLSGRNSTEEKTGLQPCFTNAPIQLARFPSFLCEKGNYFWQKLCRIPTKLSMGIGESFAGGNISGCATPARLTSRSASTPTSGC